MNIANKKIGITAASLVAAIPVVLGGQEYLDSKYATAQSVQQLSIEIWYGQYYDRLDDFDEAIAEGNHELAEEYARQMERIKAKICEHDPEWERC